MSPLHSLARRVHRAIAAACLFASACRVDRATSAAIDDVPARAPSVAGGDTSATHRWTDARTWPSGRVPVDGDDVTIPAGVRVELNGATAALRSLNIDGTLAVLDGTNAAISSHTIVVRGRLEAGRAEAPLASAFTITLAGTEADLGAFGPATNGILVESGGAIELHAVAPNVAWTRLDATARAGAATLVLSEPVDWRIGDRVVIASTDYDASHAEEAVVVGVDGRSVRLDRALAFDHWGELQRVDGRDVDERAEIGVLTRRIVIRGDTSSEATGFGGHVMILAGATAHLDGVELHRMGQRGRMARYPVHWHLASETEGQYVRRSSVWHSYNRCVTIHGTHGVTLEDNVCYDEAGHGFFLEDGIEHRNVLAGNLGLRTRATTGAARLLPSDERPATFWITNPDNTLRGNVAAGADGYGFWYALPEHPTGLSATTAIWPRRTALGAFDANRAHSNRRSGLWVDEGPNANGEPETAFYTPMRGDVSAPAVFRGFVAYKNQHHGAWLRGGDLHLDGSVLADNMAGATFAGWESTLDEALVVGESANRGANPGAWAEPRGFWFYDGRVAVRHSTFANFRGDAGTRRAAFGFHPFNPWPINAQNWIEDVRFVNADAIAFEAVSDAYDGTKSATIVDRDGSLGGGPNASVVAPTSFLARGDCITRAEWRALLCASRVAGLTVRAPDALGGDVRVRRLDRPSAEARVAPVLYDSSFTQLTVPVGVPLDVVLANGTPRALLLDGSGYWGGDVLDASVPFVAGAATVVRDGAGAVLRRVDASAIGTCVGCWAPVGIGTVRVRAAADGRTGRASATIGDV